MHVLRAHEPGVKLPGSAILLVLLLLSGCGSTPSVKTIDPARSSPLLERLSLGDEPSEATLETLRILSLDQALGLTPEGVVRVLESTHHELPQRDLLAAQAEIGWLTAAGMASRRPRQAARWYLFAAARAYDYLFDPGDFGLERAFDSRYQQMVTVYRRSVAGYVTWLKEESGNIEPRQQTTPLETLEVRLETGDDLWPWTAFDQLVPAHTLDVRGFRRRHQRDGLGAPLVGVRENVAPKGPDRFYPEEGLIYPATAVITFAEHREDGGHRCAHVWLYDPRKAATVSVAGQVVPLSADWSAPYAFLLDRAKLPSGWLNADKAMNRLGLYLMEPYDPNKIPVVLVHGLRSSPEAWTELTNELVGDPDLRPHYQVWHFMYPTALPFLFAGGYLREALRDVRRTFDPEGDDLATNAMVIVGHSMGGLVARSLVTDSGMQLWNTAFTVPPEEIVASPEVKRELLRTLIFGPQPFVERVIFIATPHHGSEMADSFVGRLGSGLTGLPRVFHQLFATAAAENEAILTEEMRHVLLRGGPTSIRALSPRHPMLVALSSLPIAPGVPYHSIIGDRGRFEGEQSSDGVVSYASAHLPGAASELVIPASHAAYSDPLAIAEVKRILQLHLVEREAGSRGLTTAAHER